MKCLFGMLLYCVCCVSAIVGDELKTPQPLHESLNELQWLVGTWRRSIEGGGLIGSWQGSVTDFKVAVSTDGKSLQVSYMWITTPDGVGDIIAKINETITHDAKTGGFTGKYEYTVEGVPTTDPQPKGQGRYDLKKTDENVWTGDQSFTTNQQTGASTENRCTFTLRKHQDNDFSVSLRGRTHWPVREDGKTVFRFVRQPQKEK